MKTQEPLKSKGTWDVRRRINVPAMAHTTDEMRVERAISALPAVHQVATDLEKHRISIRYDASQLAYNVIVEALEGTGFPPLNSWWSRVKGNWYQFSDINARDNAKAPPPACCNKPPK